MQCKRRRRRGERTISLVVTELNRQGPAKKRDKEMERISSFFLCSSLSRLLNFWRCSFCCESLFLSLSLSKELQIGRCSFGQPNPKRVSEWAPPFSSPLFLLYSLSAALSVYPSVRLFGRLICMSEMCAYNCFGREANFLCLCLCLCLCRDQKGREIG